MLKVLLVRHAEPVHPRTPGYDEYTRPLTERGLREAESLTRDMALELDGVYSSPYRRAIQTVEPLAEARGLSVETIEDWREHALAPQPIPDWQDVLERAWTDFDFALPGGETMRETQSRGMAALEAIRKRHAAGTIAVGGHGTIFSLVLNAFEPQVDCVFHLAMPMPAVYTLEFRGSWRVVSGPGFQDGSPMARENRP